MAANITFIGGPGTDAEELNWGGLTFPLNTPVLVDPEAAETSEMRRFYEYMIIKAKTHPALTIEEVVVELPALPAGNARDENGTEIAGEIPADWKTLHHKKIIALAKRLGGEGDALATRDGAIEYVELYLAAQGTEGATGD
jgi:hypothetical protein